MQHGDRVIAVHESPVAKKPAFLAPHRWTVIANALGLSGRELDVVRCILDGRSEESTAGVLGISSHTVHTHVDRLHRKLQVGNRAELILRIFREYVSLVEEEIGNAANAARSTPEDGEESP